VLIYSFLIPMLLCIVLGGLFVYKSDPSTSIFLLEYADLFFPIIIWNVLILNSVIENMSCLFEVYSLSTVIILYTFIKYKFPFSRTSYSLIGTIFLNILPIIVRVA